jgi:tetratricopeptide (TPR) repeat protein
MAHDSADFKPMPVLPIDSDGSQPDILEVEDAGVPAQPHPSMGAIGKILALNEEGWDIDDQVRTLKTAAERAPPSEPGQHSGGELPLRKPTSIPPPLPPNASKAPPPVPRKGPPPLPRNVTESTRPPPPHKSGDAVPNASLVDLLSARIAALESGADRIGLSRAHVELAIVHEILGDDDRCVSSAESALQIDPDLASAHALLRRKKHARGALMEMLAHLDHELDAATSEGGRVELMVEKARLLDAIGERPEVIRAAWSRALSHAPRHAAALKGLEADLAILANRPDAPAETFEALAAHLGHMADAYDTEPRLAAWLQVERAHILEKRLARGDASRTAFEKALKLDPRVGPVRSAFVRYVSARGDASALVLLLDEEATLEVDSARSARLELEAATIARTRLGDAKRAATLLERAANRAPTTPSVDRRVLDDLIRSRESEGQWVAAALARRARLRFVAAPFLPHELRALATLSEKVGDLDSAISDVQRALGLEGTDVTLLETLDRLLAAAGKNEQRVSLWLTEAARIEEGPKRARALVRAAFLSEQKLHRPAEAIRHLRTAWTAAPGDPEVLDALSRLLRPTFSEVTDAEARALLELYAQAVATAHDEARKIAYLEKMALVWEDLIGDSTRAARVYEEILAIEPDRRGAILGLARTSARVGDDRGQARSLLEEARLAEDGVDVLSLRTRAATILARQDPARALHLATEVLEQEPAHTTARALATRLHEEAGRWELAAQSIRARIEQTPKAEKLPLLLSLAQIEETHLKAPLEALATLKAARTLDPRHPVAPESIARLLESVGDSNALREALEALAADATSPEERAYYFVRAAEIDELRLGDDARAADFYARALRESPDDDMIGDRLTRVLTRRAATTIKVATSRESLPPPSSRFSVPSASRPPPSAANSIASDGTLAELVPLLEKAAGCAGAPERSLEAHLDLAMLLVDTGSDPARATEVLESILADDPACVPALRLLESITRQAASWAPLARILDRQAGAFRDTLAQTGALWALAALEEWRLPITNPTETYRRILDLDPTDPGALEAIVRRELPNVRRADLHARRATVEALRALCAFAAQDSARVAIQLRLALVLEEVAVDAPEQEAVLALREALDRYREAMDTDALSVTATTGVARLAGRLNDAAGAVRAALALAELAVDPRVRSRYLFEAADLLLSARGDALLGAPIDRSERAAALLERALDADPDSMASAERLTELQLERHNGPRLVETFRAVIRRAHTPEVIVLLGTEIAKVARDEMRDLTIAIDAMRVVHQAAPHHVPSLLTLAELCIAHRAWPEAVQALESVATTSHDPAPRLSALFALASIYEKVLARPSDTERVLRVALQTDPASPRALRGILRLLTGKQATASDGTGSDTAEVCDLLGRLAEVERDPIQKSDLLMELADLHSRTGNSEGAERALIEAVAQTPANTRAFARLSAICRQPGGNGHDPLRYARALNTLVGRGTQLGHVDARWLATLGQVEIESLSRLRDGIGHLQRAVQMDPTLYETRFELASALSKAGVPDEASRTLTSMILPDSRPFLQIADPGGALLLFEKTLAAEQRSEEVLVVGEIRALTGDLDEGRHTWLRARRLGVLEPHQGQLDRSTLVAHVLPPEGRHVLLDVAEAIIGVEAKALRTDLAELGISSRDRVSARSGHPTRALLDRVARTLDVADAELVIAPTTNRVRVIAQDVPWVVVPRGLVDLPEPLQMVTLVRSVARIAFGVPWLEELPAPHVLAFLVAGARIVAPGFALEGIDPSVASAVLDYEPSIARALSRKQRKLLDELSGRLTSPLDRLPTAEAFASNLKRAELRTAYVVTGDLLATLDEIRLHDPSLNRATEQPGPGSLSTILEHAFAGDVCRFALTAEATTLRRRIGAVWT